MNGDSEIWKLGKFLVKGDRMKKKKKKKVDSELSLRELKSKPIDFQFCKIGIKLLILIINFWNFCTDPELNRYMQKGITYMNPPLYCIKARTAQYSIISEVSLKSSKS